MNIGYHSARLKGNVIRRLYSRLVSSGAKRPVKQAIRLPVSVYSFSCRRDLPEQVASIRSFIQYAGVPENFVVVSDGTYTQNDVALLTNHHGCISVIDWRKLVLPDLPDAVCRYAKQRPLGKKLAIAVSLPVEQATILLDSDILFFAGAKLLEALIEAPEPAFWYLPDARASLDQRLMRRDVEMDNPVNSGFMLLQKPLTWTNALLRLQSLQDEPGYFTEQTVVHLAMHNNKSNALEATDFVVQLDDQFFYKDKYAHKGIALRHYVNPVRHKMWSRLPR